MIEKERDKVIDVLKGIAVLAVLLGHAIQRSQLIEEQYENVYKIFKMIYSFHMPLFMILSGYTMYKYTKEYDINFLKKRFLRLIIPTIVWSYLIYIVRSFDFVGIKEFIAFPDNIMEYTKLLFWHPDTLIWFLYIVFLCNLIFFIQRNILDEKYKKTSILVTILISVIIYMLPNENFGIASLQIYFPIFSLGYYLAIYLKKIEKYLKYLVIPSFVIYIFLFKKYNVYIDNVIVYYCISISAIIIIYNIVSFMNFKMVNNVLSFFGEKSLEIYLCQ